MMNEQLHRYLDGEISWQELPERLRAEARAWDAFLEEVRALGPAGAPAGFEAAVVRAVLGEPGESWLRRRLAWWVRPRTVSVSPLAGLAAVAAVLLLTVVAPFGSRGSFSVTEGPPASAAAPSGTAAAAEATPDRDPPAARGAVYVKFLLEAPHARSVSLAGNFTEWTPKIELQDADGDGVWTALVPMRPGVHEYMFVIDGSRWVTDPYAERYEDDGFGNRNAVLAIAPPRNSGL